MPPAKPDTLNSLSKFKLFWDQWTAYMSVSIGAADCSLTYVFRKLELPTPADMTWDGDNMGAMATKVTTLSGFHYRIDNVKVWEELQALVRKGPGWAFIRPFEAKKDGCGACLAL